MKLPSRVLHIFTGAEDMTHGYWGYDSRVLMMWLTDTEDMTHGYWWCDSRILMIWLTGNAYPHGYWGYGSRALRIWLTGTDDMTHGFWISSRVLHIVYTGWNPSTGTYLDQQIRQFHWSNTKILSSICFPNFRLQKFRWRQAKCMSGNPA